jgi:hypothetical protein
LKAKNDQLHIKDEQIEAIQRLLEAPKTYTLHLSIQNQIQQQILGQKVIRNDGLTTQQKEAPIQAEIQNLKMTD